MPPAIRITVDGRLALTIEQAATRYGNTPSGLRRDLARTRNSPSPVTYLDGRKPLYLAADLDAWQAARPGRGAPGRPRSLPRRPG